MNYIFQKYKNLWTKEQGFSLASAILFILLAFVSQRVADIYVGNLQGVLVGDLILDHLPIVDIDGFIIQMALFITFISVVIVALKPRYILFTVKALSIFVIIRSFFISLTHLGISPHQVVFDTQNIGYAIYDYLYNTKGDFFFSAHTGLPFLLALIFWHEKKIHIFFLVISVLSGVSVLLARMHYSIDVFAAPFMTYGIFIIATKLFPKDYKLIG